MKEEVPIYEERAVDRDLLVEGQRNLRDYFQSQGYFDAKATFQEGRMVNGKQEIDYQIELGHAAPADGRDRQRKPFFQHTGDTGTHADGSQVVRDPPRAL